MLWEMTFDLSYGNIKGMNGDRGGKGNAKTLY